MTGKPSSNPTLYERDKPIIRLVEHWKDKIPWLIKQSQVREWVLSSETEKWPITLKIVALAPQQWKWEKRWRSIAKKLKMTRFAQAASSKVLTTNPKKRSDEFDKEKDTQLMANHPFIVMKDWTRYWILISVPEGFNEQWETFEEDIDPLKSFMWWVKKTKIWKRKRSLTLAVRTDWWDPLYRIETWEKLKILNEVFGSGFEKSPNTQWRESAFVSNRITAKKTKETEWIGESVQEKSIQENLIFSSPSNWWVKWDVNDQQWTIEVVVYQVVEEEISEITEQQTPGILEWLTWSGNWFDGTFSASPMTRSYWWELKSCGSDTLSSGNSGGFKWGKTEFWKKTRKKVNVAGVRVEKPISAFKVVLVWENRKN